MGRRCWARTAEQIETLNTPSSRTVINAFRVGSVIVVMIPARTNVLERSRFAALPPPSAVRLASPAVDSLEVSAEPPLNNSEAEPPNGQIG